jgi:hypothetical protein
VYLRRGHGRVDIAETGLQIAPVFPGRITESFLKLFFMQYGAFLRNEPAEIVRMQLGSVKDEPVDFRQM